MKVITTATAMSQWAAEWKTLKIGFVPTMGYLHAGHMSLVAEARKRVGPEGKVALSIYVNPTQFGPAEDLSKYPRDLDHDKQLCLEAGVDALFVPENAQMYPEGYSTYVVEEQLSKTMEGACRPVHFRGVTTVVAKLFNLVQPCVAVFGAKDYQQAAIIQQMVRDLNFPIEIVVAPTVREPDGLAMSSRNKYLSGSERQQALVLSKSLVYAHQAVAAAPLTVQKLREEMSQIIASASSARLDYIEFFDPKTLCAATEAKPGVHVAMAVFIGKTRLIDNARL